MWPRAVGQGLESCRCAPPWEETQMGQAGRMGGRVRMVRSRGCEEPESQAQRESWGGRSATHWEDRAAVSRKALRVTVSDPQMTQGAGLDPGQALCPCYCEVPEP